MELLSLGVAAFTSILLIVIILLCIKLSGYKALVDNASDIIFYLQLKPRRRFKYISKSAEKFCGYKQQQFYLNPDIFTRLTHPDDHPLLEFVRENPIKNINPVIMRWITREGSVIWIERKITRIHMKRGEVYGIEGYIRNISHQKKEEFSLRETSRLFKELFNNATDCILLYQYTDDGVSGQLLVVNEIATKLLEYSHDELLKGSFSALLDRMKIPQVINIMKHISAVGKLSYETELIAKSGKAVAVEINANITRRLNETVILAIARNIELRRKMEEELLKNQKLESIGILAGGLAHDFNNYLSVILGNIDLAINFIYNPTKLKEILTDTEKAILKATGLTHQLLTFSKGGMPIKQSASISDVIKETAIFDLRGVNIDCKFDIPDNLWPVEFDIGQINQVFNNLIINARQAMPEGGSLEIKAENIFVKDGDVPLLNSGRYIRIIIKDNGVGIPEENKAKIFDPFFTTKENGSGLGLALSYSIIKKHAGTIILDSETGKGAIFTIYMPALDSKKDTGNLNKNDNLIMGQEKILVLDDEMMIMKTLGKMLEFLGYRMDFCTTGEDTIRLYRKALENNESYDAVIMDLTIQGGMGGDVAIKKILEIDPDACVIVSSGYSTHPIMANYGQYGFKNVISKPYTIKKLSEVLNETIVNNKKRKSIALKSRQKQE